MRKKKVLFVQQGLQPLGGGSCVAAWAIEALKDTFSVSLLSWVKPELEVVNRFCGTSLKNSDLKIYVVNPVIKKVIEALDPDPESIQRISYLMRICKRINKNYDIIMSADNEIDFGKGGIQYVHYPYLKGKVSPILEASWHVKALEFLKGRYRPWMLISGFSFERMKKNLILTNSNWTADLIRRSYGVEPLTVYPPVPGQFLKKPWQEKVNGFACVGRIVPEKRVENMISILKKVRSLGWDLHFHIMGATWNRPGDQEYFSRILRHARENASWLFVHQNIARQELIELVSKQRYGIHATPSEHFGIGVAELVRCGCITFVPNNGGQVEIIGNDARLAYDSEEDAVEKIVRVLKSGEEQEALSNRLQSRGDLFSAENFVKNIQKIVGNLFN